MTTVTEAKRLIETDEDFVYLKRFGFSLKKLLERYPDGVPSKVIAQALLMTEEEVEELYQSVVVKMREALKVELD